VEPRPVSRRRSSNREKAKVQLADMIQLKTEHVPKAKRTKITADARAAERYRSCRCGHPDHMHATIALAAMSWVSTYTCKSADLVGRRSAPPGARAKETKVATQMGIKGIHG